MSAPTHYSPVSITHPNCNTWIASFRKEKSVIQSLNTYIKIGLAKYRALLAKGAPHAIPTMCVLSIKKDKMLDPLQAKSCIVVLGNHEDRVWTKPEKYAPILWPGTMRLFVGMAVRRILKQGDCKNTFCQGILRDEDITIVKLPIGNPDIKKDKYWLLKQMLYGLRQSPRHWYTKIKTILDSLGLRDNVLEPCLFAGTIVNPSNPAMPPSKAPLTLGLYVDNFIYFSEDPEAKH
jgi:hypothetical protein